MGKKRKAAAQQHDIDSLPSGCHHYEDVEDVPERIQRYFAQRYDIFSRYDEGIWLTDDSWFGVTPEPVADKIAQHLSEGIPHDKKVIIDAFGGGGGNVIAFARSGRWDHVYGIEYDAATLLCAKHNAMIYGVEDSITWYQGDCFEVLKNDLAHLKDKAVIFGSPPWGGPEYRFHTIFDLDGMQPYNLTQLVGRFKGLANEIALLLPRNSDLRQLAELENGKKKPTVIHYCMHGASKGLCVYLGNILFDDRKR